MYSNGDRYEGEFSQSKKVGIGKYFFKNGTIYEGNFQNDSFEGKGVLKF